MQEVELKRWPSCLGVLAFPLLLFLLLVLIFFPVRCASPEDGRRVQASNDIFGLITAIVAYQTEYGALPLNDVARFEDEATQARLLRVLRSPGSELNPRRVVFFEAREARKRWWNAQYKGGIHPGSGALIDPWGNPYRIRVAQGDSGRVVSPYLDDRGEEIRSPVIIWSLGKDGVQGSPGKENILEGSDDVVSWR